jgi:hypothetical protein
MNPFVGIQMALVGGFWAFQRFLLPKWKFNIIPALAWTWVTKGTVKTLVTQVQAKAGIILNFHFGSKNL